jgi:phytoene dehydrogenase-like protein
VDNTESFDVVVIGAGMGGMLAACQLAQAGKRVLLVEKLSFLGGRFSGFQVAGAEVPSGAFHTFPHGANGPFAQALQRSGIDIDIPDANVFASFHVDGEHIIAKNPIAGLMIFMPAGKRIAVLKGILQSWWKKEYNSSLGDWFVEIGIPEQIQLVLDRFSQFALSTTIFDIPFAEARKVTGMIFKYGLPGVPVGGARQLARQLGQAARKAGVVIRKHTQVQDLLVENDRVSGVKLFNRRGKESYRVAAPVVISNIGPGSTFRLCEAAGMSFESGQPMPQLPPAAVGLKLIVLSPKSLIDHNSIMFCLDTQRVAGILQASNSDPNLAPPGKHLLISHQTIPTGADWQEERQLALQDWRYLFGSDYDKCEVLGSSHFPANFPVNWAVQGHDLRTQVFAEQGLWMVGDGLKPEGLMMVEGVGASADTVVRHILGEKNTTPWEISQFRAWSRRVYNWFKSSTTGD